MIEEEDRSLSPRAPSAANDNGGRAAGSEDPRILRIAEAIGRKLARDHIKGVRAANDNDPDGLDPAG